MCQSEENRYLEANAPSRRAVEPAVDIIAGRLRDRKSS
jgi:hypothetical protein